MGEYDKFMRGYYKALIVFAGVVLGILASVFFLGGYFL